MRGVVGASSKAELYRVFSDIAKILDCTLYELGNTSGF